MIVSFGFERLLALVHTSHRLSIKRKYVYEFTLTTIMSSPDGNLIILYNDLPYILFLDQCNEFRSMHSVSFRREN